MEEKMKTSFYHKSLLCGLLLAFAGSPMSQARLISINNSAALWSEINPAPTTTDTIEIINGGVLYVDAASGVCGNITIGGSDTAGTLYFFNATSLACEGNVIWGGLNAANSLNMAGGAGIVSTIKVKGSFLTSGSGTFTPGLGTVEYNGTAGQVVQALVYKNLTLSGSPTTGTAGKTINGVVTVNGKLLITGKAALVNGGVGSILYGSLSTLEYAGAIAQTISDLEFPLSMDTPVTISTTDANGGVTLNQNKTINALLTIGTGCTFKDGGNILTAKGNIANSGKCSGTGKVYLNGTSAQTLSGVGSYVNLELNSASGAVLSDNTTILGRLTLTLGTLTLNTSTSHTAVLLTYGGADKAAGTYTAVAGVFGGTGVLTVGQKPASTIGGLTMSPGSIITYGTMPVTVSGTVTGGANGNTVRNGETVTVTLTLPSGGTRVETCILANNANTFTATFGTPAVAYSPTPLPIAISYSGGINLAGSPNNSLTLTVNKKIVYVTPNNVSKTYGVADATGLLSYTYASDPVTDPILVATPADAFTGDITRNAGEAANAYNILQGTLLLNNNYDLRFVSGKTLTINKKDLRLTANARSKTYGGTDPSLTYATTPGDLLAGDNISGALGRTPGETAGVYPINIGTLTAGNNYNILFTPNSLTINPLAVTVTFNPISKTYGQSDPTLAYTFSPALPFGDSFTGSPGREDGENVRTANYVISLTGGAAHPSTLSLGTKANNYTVTAGATPVKLTILPKAVTITALSPSKLYGAVIPALVSYNGLVKNSAVVADDPDPTTTVVGSWSPSQPTQFSLPGAYTFSISGPASDASGNHTFTYPSPNGTLAVNKAPLQIIAANKAKVADGLLYSPFTVTYATFVAGSGDTEANSLTGTLTFSGTATTATTKGVYTDQIIPSGLSSVKYDIQYVPGTLTITGTIGTYNLVGNQTWSANGNYAWEINNANGTAGANPGWKLYNITSGKLTIGADAVNKFIVNISTLNPSTDLSGAMAKFDPTRAYSWKIVQATGGIEGFDVNKFQLNSAGSGLFMNSTFGGVFSIGQVNSMGQVDNNAIYISYTPATPVPGLNNDYWDTRSVGTLGDPNTLLGYVTGSGSDLDVLYLQPSSLTITPQESLTVYVKVANLRQPVFGAQVFLKFSSTFFNATGPNGPVVAAGDGSVWNQLIYTMWKVAAADPTVGQLDTVIGLAFTELNGTMLPGTVASITLKPTRTATGASRVEFRPDTDVMIDGITGGTSLTSADPVNPDVRPARVMTDLITIVGDTTGPNILSTSATQNQPYTAAAVDVKGGAKHTVRGTVLITVNASDAGVGLSGAPTVTLTPAGGSALPALTCLNPGILAPFNYEWPVDANTANGDWNVAVVATDTIRPTPNSTTVSFKLTVNTRQIAGVVELESFKGVNRVVTFKAGTGSGTKTWDLDLNFGSTTLLPAGAFRNLAAFATSVNAPTTATSTYLRYGAIANLPALVSGPSGLLLGTGGVSAYLRTLLFGDIVDLTTLANKLQSPNNAALLYVQDKLSDATMVILAAYQSVGETKPPTLVTDLKKALLRDFNTIVLEPVFYDPLRFASVTRSTETLAAMGSTPPADSGTINRLLLQDVLASWSTATPPVKTLNYLMGDLNPATAAALVLYPGSGADPALEALLLKDFDTLSQRPASLYTETRFLGVTLLVPTQELLLSNPAGPRLTQLNRMLLEDAYANAYTSAPLSPETVAAIGGFVATPATVTKATLEPLLLTDLNALIGKGVYTKLDLQNAFSTQLSRNMLAKYTLIDVTAGTTMVSAKTAWNLRETLTGLSFVNNEATANFVNNGLTRTVGQFYEDDHFLRAGDMVPGNNIINLLDFTVLQANWAANGSAADLNGDGMVDNADYNLLRNNFGKIGDNEVQ